MKGKDVDYFVALYDVAKAINASLDPLKVLEKIVQSVVKAMNVKAGSIRLLDSRGRMLVLGAASGLSKGYVRKGPILIEESGLDRKVLKGRSIWRYGEGGGDQVRPRRAAHAGKEGDRRPARLRGPDPEIPCRRAQIHESGGQPERDLP
jgi:hypothetical protein